jgi:predicted transcriptional regulator
MKKQKEVLTLNLPKELKEELAICADKNERSMTAQAIVAIRQFLNTNKEETNNATSIKN